MSVQKYESGKLNSILQALFKKKASGVLSLKTEVVSWSNQRACIFILQNGSLMYGEIQTIEIPNNQEICQLLGKKLKPNIINAALSVALEKITNPTSVRELLKLLIKMRVFTWQEVETFVTNKIIIILEQFLPHPGEAKWQGNIDFDLSYGEDQHGLNWSAIKQGVLQRQKHWQKYLPTIPRMDAIPSVTSEQLQQIADPIIKQHLATSANGQNTLLDIADKMGKDPLKVATSYLNWANNGWVTFGTTPKNDLSIGDISAQNKSIQNQPKTPPANAVDLELPIVLSVDDSPIIQTSIKRALQEHYRVLLSSNTGDALQILNQHSVQLMLLDLTMPDMDGLEFCKLVRQIDKFRDLPIVMVTARDGLVNKMKGHIAGTSRYLTKPFEPEQLQTVVKELIQN